MNEPRHYRFSLTHRQAVTVLAIAVALLCIVGFAGVSAVRAQTHAAGLQARAAQQNARLKAIDGQVRSLQLELSRLQKQNHEIRQLIGAPSPHPPAPVEKTSWIRPPATIDAVATHLAELTARSRAAERESNRMKKLALKILNVQHLDALARARVIAAIPSIDPVDGAAVVGCFCYRTYPDSEFHEGVDLGADYGETVRAAAAGTVVSAAYDGSYGIKIDIDHGNGYHTWYAHLSRVDVDPGQHVYKGEAIAAVGATGFATGPHLHYQLMYDGQPIDPTPFLHGVPAQALRASHGLASLP